MLNRIALAAAFATISTLAVAQTPAPTTTTPAAPMVQPAPATSMSTDKGMSMANTATVAVRFVTTKPADVMTSKLIGINVLNNQNETLGEVEDLVIDNGKNISGVVVSVGGFLGLGESYVVLDPSTIVLNQKDGTMRAFVDTSKDNLKNAPKFTYTKNKK